MKLLLYAVICLLLVAFCSGGLFGKQGAAQCAPDGGEETGYLGGIMNPRKLMQDQVGVIMDKMFETITGKSSTELGYWVEEHTKLGVLLITYLFLAYVFLKLLPLPTALFSMSICFLFYSLFQTDTTFSVIVYLGKKTLSAILFCAKKPLLVAITTTALFILSTYYSRKQSIPAMANSLQRLETKLDDLEAKINAISDNVGQLRKRK